MLMNPAISPPRRATRKVLKSSSASRRDPVVFRGCWASSAAKTSCRNLPIATRSSAEATVTLRRQGVGQPEDPSVLRWAACSAMDRTSGPLQRTGQPLNPSPYFGRRQAFEWRVVYDTEANGRQSAKGASQQGWTPVCSDRNRNASPEVQLELALQPGGAGNRVVHALLESS